ncbi:site-specific DNA-methyltransferase [Erythrobacter aureus]|uniref:Methyltransferase n=1 Tax=Erythrobacter aureus TaxID=2182384 RepID=A0A345YJF8_9SPHN|nr:site-specific DNA-methyltransferase [Erythrobacter aureus]AXK44060.1 DNA methylase [Erythrobacter aureus]
MSDSLPTNLPTQRQLVLPILDAVDKAGGEATTAEIRNAVADQLGLDETQRNQRGTIGGQDHNLLAHRIRWGQQHSKLAGLIERDGRAWRLTDTGSKHLTSAFPGRPVTVFFTPNGCALWGMAEDAASVIDPGTVRLLLTSPPYPLKTKKEYGNKVGQEYIDWLCSIIERLMPVMESNGSLVLNLGDTWLKNSPTVSMYQERTIIALQDRLGLHLCQRLLWHNPSALPVPSNYVGVERIRLKQAVECLWWLSPEDRPYADNRAILEPYSDRMKKLIEKGGAVRSKKPSGHATREGSFAADNGGSIAPNIFRIPNSGDQQYTRACRDAGLPPHPARMPIPLASKMIEFLSQPGEVVFDPFGGSGSTARAAEDLGRHWITTEAAREYVEGAKLRFSEELAR